MRRPARAEARRAAYRFDRPRRFHPPGPRRSAGADPARTAAPAGAREADPRDRRQDDLARPQRPSLPLADGASGIARLPFLWAGRAPPFPLLPPDFRTRRPVAAASDTPQSHIGKDPRTMKE